MPKLAVPFRPHLQRLRLWHQGISSRARPVWKATGCWPQHTDERPPHAHAHSFPRTVCCEDAIGNGADFTGERGGPHCATRPSRQRHELHRGCSQIPATQRALHPGGAHRDWPRDVAPPRRPRHRKECVKAADSGTLELTTEAYLYGLTAAPPEEFQAADVDLDELLAADQSAAHRKTDVVRRARLLTRRYNTRSDDGLMP